mgnify:CR=1 FL=1
MKPFEDYINQLFKPLNISNNRILTFSCEHVIEKDHLIAIGCGRGPNNAELNFTYSSRSLPKTIDETGQAVLKYCQAIPKGVVVFFPSYDYEDLVLKQWQHSGILKRIESCKRVFKEPRKATLTAAVLNGYTRVNKASQSNGAVLFSVIGGKMSEGINFSDDLGRGVIVLGLPYANKNSVELQEKMAFLERSSAGLANVSLLEDYIFPNNKMDDFFLRLGVLRESLHACSKSVNWPCHSPQGRLCCHYPPGQSVLHKDQRQNETV